MNEENSSNLPDREEIEGLDQEEIAGWGEYPLDSVFVRQEIRTVSEVVKRIENDRYTLDPDFQRDFIWDNVKQSRLIESCLMRIPLPVFYVAEAKDGKIIIVDGLQRLTTFYRFVNNNFALKGLGNNTEESNSHPLIGKKFKDLSVKLRERIEDTQITLYILDEKAPERAKLDIFERVNGGVALTRQQMRNCLFLGQATLLLKELSRGKEFIKTTGGSLNSKTMRDREVVNRFCAFKTLGLELYKGDMDDFLAQSLAAINKLDETSMVTLRKKFINSMVLNYRLFNKHAFRKTLRLCNNRNVNRSVINVALFDVLSFFLSDLSMDVFDAHEEDIRSSIIELMEDENFLDSITNSTNSTACVEDRFEAVENALEYVLGFGFFE